MREFKDSVTAKHEEGDREGEVIDPPRENVTTATADEETETARKAREAKTADAS
jgi:hypothetical protein